MTLHALTPMLRIFYDNNGYLLQFGQPWPVVAAGDGNARHPVAP